MDSSSSKKEPENPSMDAKPDEGDNDDDDDDELEEMKLLKVIHEYRMCTIRDPNHGYICMKHFYYKWLKKYNYPQASLNMFDLSVKILELFIRYEDQLEDFPNGEVDPSLEDEWDPLELNKFKLSHEIWKQDAYLIGSCDSLCEQDYSISDDDEDGNGADGDGDHEDENGDEDEDGNGADRDGDHEDKDEEEEEEDGDDEEEEEEDGDEDDDD